VYASALIEVLSRTSEAEVLDAPLLTRERRLAAASGHRARIELV
jgi:hypothetical protein